MKVSVVTVSLNARTSIEQCVQSVLMQDYQNIEYIVVDGASTDGTLDVLSKYRDRVSSLHSSPDRGLYDAMNKGVGLASGDYIYFLNSDDRFCDARVISDVVRTAQRNPGADLIYGDVLRADGTRLVRHRHGRKLSRKSVCRYGFCHQALFARRSLFSRSGSFSLDYKIVSDGDWLMRVLGAGANSLYLPRDIAVFSAGGLSDTTDWRGEKRRVLRAHYSSLELFLWRKLPGLFGRGRLRFR